MRVYSAYTIERAEGEPPNECDKAPQDRQLVNSL